MTYVSQAREYEGLSLSLHPGTPDEPLLGPSFETGTETPFTLDIRNLTDRTRRGKLALRLALVGGAAAGAGFAIRGVEFNIAPHEWVSVLITGLADLWVPGVFAYEVLAVGPVEECVGLTDDQLLARFRSGTGHTVPLCSFEVEFASVAKARREREGAAERVAARQHNQVLIVALVAAAAAVITVGLTALLIWHF